MNRNNKPFTTQLVIVGGFIIFIYIFFALTTSIYKDYQLDVNIEKFEDEINNLANLANQKPKDVKYYLSEEYKDKYAKESLNLLNPGEKLIILPQENAIVKSEIILDRAQRIDVLNLPNRNQWWEYFFGHTLSLKVKNKPKESLLERVNPDSSVNEGVLLEVEG